jgi:hypothetical protein
MPRCRDRSPWSAVRSTLDSPALIAIAGLSYNSDMELLDLAADAVKPNVKAVSRVILDVVGSLGILAGETFDPPGEDFDPDDLIEAKLRNVEDDFDPTELVTGQVEVHDRLELEHGRPGLHPAEGPLAAHHHVRDARRRSRRKGRLIMDPVTIALFSIGMNMVGGFLKGRAEKQAAEANAQTAEQNAVYADQAAADAIARGTVREGQIRLAGSSVASRQQVALASSGVDVQAGSAVDAVANTAGLSALDALMARSNATREAWGYKVQGAQYRRQAQVLRATGDANATGAILGGVIGSARIGMPFLRVSGQGEDPGSAAASGQYDAASIGGSGI